VAETVLDRIVEAVRQRLQETPPRPDLREAAAATAERRLSSDRRSLAQAVRMRSPAVIAECKRASPSAGVLRQGLDPEVLAKTYAGAGAAAISVVTEPDFFAGDPAWIASVRAAVELPVLRKDFIFCRRQLEETVLLGADAVLLIQRILSAEAVDELVGAAHELGLEVLLEVFADEDPAPTAASDADLIGVNARDLSTFEMRFDRVAELAEVLPTDRPRVAESGIHNRSDLDRLAGAGYDAFLVGQYLVTADDPGSALRELTV
jgi:indole-3-glycerol phosphate synthase